MTFNLPLWIWPIIGTTMIILVSFLYTKKLSDSIIYAMKIILLAVASYSLVAFEHYLQATFIGHYDKTGQPNHFSHSGWLLLIEAWPLWLTPLLIVMLIQSGTLWLREQLKSPVTQTLPTDLIEKNAMVEKLHAQHEATKKERDLLEHEQQILLKKISVLEAEKPLLKPEPIIVDNKLSELKRIMSEQNKEIKEANELIDTLLKKLGQLG